MENFSNTQKKVKINHPQNQAEICLENSKRELSNLLNQNDREIFNFFELLFNPIKDLRLKEKITILFIKVILGQDFNCEVTTLKNIISDKLKFEEVNSTDVSLDIYCTNEINYLMLYFLSKNFNQNKKNPPSEKKNVLPSSFLYNNKTDEQAVLSDILNLINLNDFYENPFSSIVKYISEVNYIVRSKDFLTSSTIIEEKLSQATSHKIMISNMEYLLDIIFFASKYLLSSNSRLLHSQLGINIENFSHITKNLFMIFFEYLMSNYRTFHSLIKDKFFNFPYFENYLIMSNLITSVISDVKFKEKSLYFPFEVDFTTFYPAFNESFAEEFFNQLKFKFISKLNDLGLYLENIDKYSLEKLDMSYFSPSLLELMKESLADFLICHFTSMMINENNYEMENKSAWLKPIIKCLCFADILKQVYSVIIQVLSERENTLKNNVISKNLPSVSGEIRKHIENKFNSFSKLIPRRLMILKDLYSLTYLIIFNYLLVTFPFFQEEMSKSEIILHYLEEVKTFQNKFYFILSNNILKILKKDNYKHEIRVYCFETSPLDYFDVNFTNFGYLELTASPSIEEITSKTEDCVIDFTDDRSKINKPNKENVCNNVINFKPTNSYNLLQTKSPLKCNSTSSNNLKDVSINNSSQNISKKKSTALRTSFKNKYLNYDITHLTKVVNFSLLKNLENKTSKKIKVTNNKNGELLIKFKHNNYPNSLVLSQNESEINIFSSILNNDVSNNHHGLTTQTLKFMKEWLSYDLINKNDYNLLLSIEVREEPDSPSGHETSQPMSPFPDNKTNCLKNLKQTFKYYDLNSDKLDYDEVIANLINLLK